MPASQPSARIQPPPRAWYPPSPREGREVVPFTSLGPAAVALTSAAVGAYLIHILYAVFVSRHLFGDGAWFLLKMLVENHVARWYSSLSRDFFVSRFGAFFCHEYPTLLASRLGVTDLGTLSSVYGLTLFVFKPLSLLLCYVFSPDKRAILFPLLGLFAGSINAEAYMVSETHLFASLFWLHAKESGEGWIIPFSSSTWRQDRGAHQETGTR